jgi:hypothetical protein
MVSVTIIFFPALRRAQKNLPKRLLPGLLISDTRSETGRGIETWTIVLKNKSRMSVTPSYGHPVNNFIAAIRRLRPELPVREYDRRN